MNNSDLSAIPRNERGIEVENKGENMSHKYAGTWGFAYGKNLELFYGHYATPEEAESEGRKDMEADGVTGTLLVGQFRSPRPPEDGICAVQIIDNILAGDDYDNDYSANWPDYTDEQFNDLEESLKEAFRQWVNRHGMQPDWGLVAEGTIRTIKVEKQSAT